MLLFLFWSLVGGWASGVEQDSHVVIAVLSDKFDLSAGVVNVPTVVVEEVNVFVGGGFVLTFVLDLLVEFFLQSVLDTGESEESSLVELDSF